MPNESIIAVSYTANIVGIVSAITAVISALCSFLSFKKSSDQFKTNQRDYFINQSKDKFDKCYFDLSNFVQQFTGSRETKEKRVVRERIFFSLDALRVELSSCSFLDNYFNELYGDISLKISDITYEKNFEKNMRDLANIKDNISNFKNMLMTL